MSVKSSLDLDSDARSIIGTREFDAPRQLVFSAWTDPKHLAQWWGPVGFSTTTMSFDFSQGGIWRFVMHGPMAAIIRTASHSRKSFRPSASCTGTAAVTTSNLCSSNKR
jgi:Activator of Hsp90 ATPase homolog 1-like protein